MNEHKNENDDEKYNLLNKLRKIDQDLIISKRNESESYINEEISIGKIVDLINQDYELTQRLSNNYKIGNYEGGFIPYNFSNYNLSNSKMSNKNNEFNEINDYKYSKEIEESIEINKRLHSLKELNRIYNLQYMQSLYLKENQNMNLQSDKEKIDIEYGLIDNQLKDEVIDLLEETYYLHLEDRNLIDKIQEIKINTEKINNSLNEDNQNNNYYCENNFENFMKIMNKENEIKKQQTNVNEIDFNYFNLKKNEYLSENNP